ncbi:MAG: STAS domain-containing protein [Lachnospiraceae bacterium]|nr:STAS domain-containing protein [Lachnospiraceae bacterium]
MNAEYIDGALTFSLSGRIDSNNVEEVEKEIHEEMSFYDKVDVAFDARDLTYISSAGLRILLRLKKSLKRPVRVFNVSDDMYDIFSVTGFTEILDVERTMRQITLHGCKKISSALNGEIFGLSEDEMIKVYDRSIPLSAIKEERSYAQAALIAGIPTLIPYDVVSCEYGYGIVFEMAGAQSLAYVLQREPEKLETYAKMFALLVREMHSTEIPEGKLPDIKDRYRGWFSELGGSNDPLIQTFTRLTESIPDKPTYVQGDISLNSVMLKDGELLLMDMAGSARGHALFDLQGLFASLVAIERGHEGYCRKTFGLSGDTCRKFWIAFFREYMKGSEAETDKTNELLLKYFVLKEKVLNLVEQKHQLREVS